MPVFAWGSRMMKKKRSCWRKREAREVGEASRGGPRINCHTKTYIPPVLQEHGVFRKSIDFTPNPCKTRLKPKNTPFILLTIVFYSIFFGFSSVFFGLLSPLAFFLVFKAYCCAIQSIIRILKVCFNSTHTKSRP